MKQLKIGYDNRTGFPEEIPYEFIYLIIAFPERIYGTWWYLSDQGTKGSVKGWYIWLESIGLMGVTRSHKVVWCEADNFECGLADVTDKLRS